VLVLLVAFGLVGYVLLGDDALWAAVSSTEPQAEQAGAAAVDVSPGDILDGAAVNGDGSVTVTLSEAETAGLVEEGLAAAGANALRDASVDLRPPDSGVSGLLELRGTLEDQPVPVTATVDLVVTGGRIAPRVRDARVGPVPVPAGVRTDLNAQLRHVGLLADRGITVDSLRTTDTELIVTGRRG
jgi:hypothetical protein